MIIIGIPTLDAPKLLKQTLDSISCNFEHRIVIINNGSNQLANLADNIEVISPPKNIGVAPAWNRIIHHVTDFDAAFFLNDDIVLHKDCIHKMVYSLQNFDAISAAVTKRLNAPLVAQRYSKGMQFSCFALTHKVIERVGEFDENFAPAYVEDTDYYYRLEQAGCKFGCDRWAKFLHYGHRNKKALKSAHNKNRRYFRQKWGIRPKEVFSRMKEGVYENSRLSYII